MRRVVVIASASGSGKTTLSRALAAKLDAPHIELDALVHGPNWTECTADELRALVTPRLAEPRWVMDGVYSGKLGTLVLDAADTVVWLDLSRRVWLPRLLFRTAKRWITQEPLWNGNRESLRAAILDPDSLLRYAWRMYPYRRETWPTWLAPYPVIRLRTPGEVDRFLAGVGYAAGRADLSG